MKNKLIVEVAGHPDAELHVWAKSSCGNIKDGVSFSHGNHGGWVISFQSLEQIYQFAKTHREGNVHASR